MLLAYRLPNIYETDIYTEWLPSSGYEQSMQYTVEIYPPGNAGSDDYVFEIWIPVKKM